MTKPSLSIALVVCLTSACGDAERPPSNPWEGAGGATLGAVSASGGAPLASTRPEVTAPTSTTSDVDRLAGTAGQVRGFVSAAPTVQISNGGRTVRLTAVDDVGRWQMMAQLDFATALSDAMWAPGTRRSVTLGGGAPATGATVRGIACSGPARAEYTFDAQPTQVTVQVTEGATPTARVVTFSQSFADPSATVTGAFEYTPR